jgi:hypothetical protein
MPQAMSDSLQVFAFEPSVGGYYWARPGVKSATAIVLVAVLIRIEGGPEVRNIGTIREAQRE